MKKRNFYLIRYRPHSRPAGTRWVNEEEVFQQQRFHIFTPPNVWVRGFREYPVKPKFIGSTKFGRRLHDIENYHEYWLVSERAKKVLSAVGMDDVKFLALEAEIVGDQEQQDYWLCDVVTMLDAIDEERSNVRPGVSDAGTKIHQILMNGKVVFDENVVGLHHLFRLTTNFRTVACDDTFKAAYKEAKLTGLMFQNSETAKF